MEINFKKSYKKINEFSVGEKINTKDGVYILTDNKLLVNIETGKTLSVHPEDKIEVGQNFQRAHLQNDIRLGDMFLDELGRLFLCTGEYNGDKYYYLSEDTWYDSSNLEYEDIIWVWLVPKESIKITIGVERPY